MSVARTSAQAIAKVPFRNDDAEEVPPCAVMQVTGSAVEDGVTLLTCTKVGATLLAQFAVNGLSRVAPNAKGVCYRWGDVSAAYESGSPEAGQAWGARAGQWTLALGYPSLVTVHEIRHETGKILHGQLASPTSVVARCTSGLPAADEGEPGTASAAIHVWNGTSFAPADPAMTITAYNLSTTSIAADALVTFTLTEGLWVATAPAVSPAGAGTRMFRAQLYAALASADSSVLVTNVASLTGDEPPAISSADNPFALAGLFGDDCLIVEDTSGVSPAYLLFQVKHHVCGTA